MPAAIFTAAAREVAATTAVIRGSPALLVSRER
jgi:hypothetical protein